MHGLIPGADIPVAGRTDCAENTYGGTLLADWPPTGTHLSDLSDLRGGALSVSVSVSLDRHRYHSEHHAWPNVPFYLLPELHEAIKAEGTRPVREISTHRAPRLASVFPSLLSYA